MGSPTFIHCDEVVVDPVIVTLGTVQVDVTKISAYNSVRVLKLIQDISTETGNADDAAGIVLDIVREQDGTLTEEDLLKAGTQLQLNAFIQTVVGYTLKVYSPLRSSDPFRVPARTRPEIIP